MRLTNYWFNQATPANERKLGFAAVLVVVVSIVACSIYWWRLTEAQERLETDSIALADLRALQLADAIAGQTAILIRMVDAAILNLRDDYVAAEGNAEFQRTLRSVMDTFPGGAILQVAVIDKDGYLGYSNLGMKDKVYLGDREHFKVHLTGSGDRLFISKPVFGRVSKSWSVQFTRPMFRGDQFLGVLVFSISPQYIAASLAVPELGSGDVISLFRSDGSYLSRNRQLDSVMGTSVPPERPFLQSGSSVHGNYRATAPVDGIRRLYGWRRLDDLPLVVSVGLEEDALLAPVRQAIRSESISNGIGIAIVMILALGVAVLLRNIAARQRALQDSERRYRSFFEANAAVKLLIDPATGTVVDANAAAVEYYGYTRQELLGMQITSINCLAADEVAAEMQAASTEHRHYFSFPHRLKSGEVRHVEVYSGPIDIDNRLLLFSIVHDVTERYRLESSQRLAKTVFDAAAEAIVVTDAENRIVAVNPVFSRITGYSPQEVMSRTPSILSSGVHDRAFYHAMWQCLLQDDRWEGEITNRRKDGQLYVEWLKIALVRSEDGTPQQYVGLFSDVTERKKHEEAVWHQANFDPLTGLPNRQLLNDRLERALAQATRRQTQVAVLYIDLDHFKPVNDRFGHAAGDNLLVQVARRLLNLLRDEDTVARVGGDEFVVVLPDLPVVDACERTATKILASIAEPYRVLDTYVEISGSIGIALFPQDAVAPAALIEKADEALLKSKRAGRAGWTRA